MQLRFLIFPIRIFYTIFVFLWAISLLFLFGPLYFILKLLSKTNEMGRTKESFNRRLPFAVQIVASVVCVLCAIVPFGAFIISIMFHDSKFWVPIPSWVPLAGPRLAVPFLPAAVRSWFQQSDAHRMLHNIIAFLVGFGVLHTSLASRTTLRQRVMGSLPVQVHKLAYGLVAVWSFILVDRVSLPLTGPPVWSVNVPFLSTLTYQQMGFLGALVLIVISMKADEPLQESLGLMDLWRTDREINSRLRKGHALRTTGIYSVMRHPLYFGLLSALLVTPELTRARFCLALSIAVYLALGGLHYEEEKLHKLYGTEWELYRDQVPSMFPSVSQLVGFLFYRSGQDAANEAATGRPGTPKKSAAPGVNATRSRSQSRGRGKPKAKQSPPTTPRQSRSPVRGRSPRNSSSKRSNRSERTPTRRQSRSRSRVRDGLGRLLECTMKEEVFTPSRGFRVSRPVQRYR